MNYYIFAIEAFVLVIMFTFMIIVPLCKNPVWWIHDYPKDIQEEYFKTHERIPAAPLSKPSSYHPDLCVGGFHLFNPVSKKSVPAMLLDDIAAELQKYQNTDFYTCHCTGKKAFRYLSGKMKNLHYISCGERIVE